MSKFTKYLPYLKIRHSWDDMNCLTLLEDIFIQFLSLNFKDTWYRAERIDGVTDVTNSWFKTYDIKVVLNEIRHWDKIPLTEIQEFDILVFVSKRQTPLHFGLYIERNMFIHIQEGANCCFSMLNDEYRDKLYGVFRHKSLVS